MASEDKTQILLASARQAHEVGSGRARRWRRDGSMPAVIYGGGQEPLGIRLAHKDMLKITRGESSFTRLLTLEVDGKSETVILKQLQRHPAKAVLLHADFQRVRTDQAVNVKVPLRFINADKCVGVKTDGGMLVHSLNELSIQCLPADLPEAIDVDVGELHLGQSLHISDIQLPSGVTSTELSHGAEHDLSVVAVQAQRVMEEDAQAAEAEEGDAAAVEAEEGAEGKSEEDAAAEEQDRDGDKREG